MDLGITPEFIRTGLLFYILLFACLILRTFAQAWLADRLGDPTPRDEGRVTLYPVPHIDLLGTVILPLICIFFLQPRLTAINFFLAWTNPVPINPANFRNPSRDYLFTQLSSCVMSIVIALVAAVLGGVLYKFNQSTAEVFLTLIGINAMLIVLDLLPIPPLPGGWVLKHFGVISEEAFWQISRWSGLVFMVAINFSPVRALLGMFIRIAATPFELIYGGLALAVR